VLVLGVPRSGTTWLAQMLAATDGARYVHEPDNERLRVDAAYAKRRLGRFPFLRAGDRAPAYGRLWKQAFAARRPTELAERADAFHKRRHGDRLAPGYSLPLGWAAQRLPRAPQAGTPIVKSVHAPMSAEWVAATASPDRVVVVTRDPLNVISSWIDLRMPDGRRTLHAEAPLAAPPPLSTALHRMAWQFSVLEGRLLEAAARHPDWIVERHESVIANPLERVPELAAALGLAWGEDADRTLRESNSAGGGYGTSRRWGELADRWRRTLSDEDAAVVRGVLSQTGR